MKQAPAFILPILIFLSGAIASAEDIILRLRPEASAPILNRITATKKVLNDAATAGENGDWMQLELTIPFDGFVPAAALTKSFAIIQDTPVLTLPDANSETITLAKDGDLYEIKRVKDEWATIRYTKKLTTYFQPGTLRSAPTSPATDPATAPPVVKVEPADPKTATAVLEIQPADPKNVPLITESLPTEPKPHMAPQRAAPNFDPALGVGSASPRDLPPENVVWKSAPSSRASTPEPRAMQAPRKPEPTPAAPTVASRDEIIVSRVDTQAREPLAKKGPAPEEPLRIITGTLVREIRKSGPAYPIRLRSPEGRLIAYIDFSGIYIEDVSTFLNQRVFLRGQLYTLGPNSRDLVMLVQNIQLAY